MRLRVVGLLAAVLVSLLGCVCLLVTLPGDAGASTSVATANALPLAPTQSPVRLTVVASRPSYLPAAQVTLHATVQNLSSTTCVLEASADGAITVLKATMDGAAVQPSYSQAFAIDGTNELVTDHLQSVAPGGLLSFTVATEPIPAVPRVGSGFDLLTPLSNQSALATSWSTVASGNYVLDVTYQAPALAGNRACAAQSNTVAVSFRVGADGHSGPRVWIYALAAAALLVVLAGIVVFSRARRRHRRGQTGAAVVVLLLGLIGSGVVIATPARADVSLVAPGDAGAEAAYAGCVTSINGYDPGFFGDFGSADITVTSTSGYTHTDLNGNSGLVHWNYTSRGHFNGDVDGSDADPCAALFHELNHARNFLDGSRDDYACAATNGIPYEEVNVTDAENGYRAANGLPLRTTYGADPLPTSLVHCSLASKLASIIRAKITGDPHVTTFDGQRYDFQAVGEFTAVTSAAGDLTVQVRQSPFEGSSSISVNSAIAVEVSGTRLGFYLEDGLVDVHRNGQSIQIPVGRTALPNGAALVRTADPYSGDNYQVEWPDGTVATVSRAAIYGLGVTVEPAKSRAGSLSGLLGNFDGNPQNDVADRGGSSFAPTFDRLYPSFADSWRVSAASSLFDYPTGESTATFTDRSLPTRPASASDLSAAQRSAALAACQAVGLSDAADLADCTLDVAVTGSAAFAIADSAVDASASSQPSTATSTPTPAPSAQSGVVTAQSTVTNPGSIAKTTIIGHKGERVLVDITSTTLPKQCGTLTLRGADDNIVAEGCTNTGTSIQGALLPVDGPYTIYVAPTGGVTGTASLKIVTSDDQVQSATIDGPAVTGSILVAGQQSSVGFAGSSGQAVFVAASGATLPGGCSLSLVGPDGGTLRLGCLSGGAGYIDATTLSATGTYHVVVDPQDDGLGSVTIKIMSVHDQTIAATVGGPPAEIEIAQPGARGLVTFDDTAGQRVLVTGTDATLPDQCGAITLLAPDQSIVTTGCIGGSGTFTTTSLPTTGTYTLVVDPYGTATGTLRLTVAAAS
jgi:von Willebrand factor type D domain